MQWQIDNPTQAPVGSPAGRRGGSRPARGNAAAARALPTSPKPANANAAAVQSHQRQPCLSPAAATAEQVVMMCTSSDDDGDGGGANRLQLTEPNANHHAHHAGKGDAAHAGGGGGGGGAASNGHLPAGQRAGSGVRESVSLEGTPAPEGGGGGGNAAAAAAAAVREVVELRALAPPCAQCQQAMGQAEQRRSQLQQGLEGERALLPALAAGSGAELQVGATYHLVPRCVHVCMP